MTWIFNLPVNLLLANCVLSRVKYMKIIQKVYKKYGVTEKILSVTLTKTNDYQYLESI